MNKLVSVIVPVYNVEKYLDRCLDSIVNQTYKNLEIVLVNDGSKDTSGELCEAWAAKDSRVKVVHKENSGAGESRNTGIDNATGEYIFFFDSDDYVDLQTVEKALALAESEKSDIVVYGMTALGKDGEALYSRIPRSTQISFEGDEVKNTFLPALINWRGKAEKVENLCLSVWSCMFSADLIRRSNWRFVSEREIISEDTFSLLILYNSVNKVSVLSEALYFYGDNSTSFSRSYSPQRFEQLKHFYVKCLEVCMEYGYSSEVEKGCRSPFIGNILGALKQEVAFHQSKADAMEGIKRIIDDSLVQTVVKDIKKDRLPVKPKVRLLFWTVRHKNYSLCYFLISLQTRGLRK